MPLPDSRRRKPTSSHTVEASLLPTPARIGGTITATRRKDKTGNALYRTEDGVLQKLVREALDITVLPHHDFSSRRSIRTTVLGADSKVFPSSH